MNARGGVIQEQMRENAPVGCGGGILEVPLTCGHAAIVDAEDGWVLQWKWNALVGNNGIVYARRSARAPDGRRKDTRLHRVIVGKECDGLCVDHIDGNGLNNRRSNLRIVSILDNSRNISNRSANARSGVLGVTWHKGEKKWQSRIVVNRKLIYLGCFNTIEEAAIARARAEIRYWGIHPRREVDLRRWIDGAAEDDFRDSFLGAAP